MRRPDKSNFNDYQEYEKALEAYCDYCEGSFKLVLEAHLSSETCERCEAQFIPIDTMNFHCQECQPLPSFSENTDKITFIVNSLTMRESLERMGLEYLDNFNSIQYMSGAVFLGFEHSVYELCTVEIKPDIAKRIDVSPNWKQVWGVCATIEEQPIMLTITEKGISLKVWVG